MYKKLIDDLSAYNARLIVVSKTRPLGQIMEIYSQGQRLFGENRPQEMTAKYESLPKDIEWHMIGQLQTNKVKYIAPFVSLIHSVDSLKLLEEIDRRALQHDRVIPCLLQVKIAKEDTKSGLGEAEILPLLESNAFQSLQHIKIVGLMGMATHTEDDDIISNEFRQLKHVLINLQDTFFKDQPDFKELSMGMSDDYLIALEEGSTMVRIGSLVFN